MKTYNNIADYINVAKTGDFVTLGGRGIICGLRAESKWDVFKFVGFNNSEMIVTKYRGRTKYRTSQDQQIGVLTKQEFNELS